ncbi:DUF6083 domain-containing protein [Streptomyces chartreusis]|uniref:DUF6083 domain-containing protein n=1 Tax=Streptomyces chartreusis TaxID=1969 RepID=UPI0036A2FE52
MHSSPDPRYRRGSPALARQRRSLRVATDSPTRLLRCAQRARCRDCGNPVEWYHRVDERPVRLHPRELSVGEVPTAYRWHVSSGLAYAAGDGSAWCRLAHVVVCPAHDATSVVTPALTRLRRTLAVNTRRLRDAGALFPTAPSGRPAEQSVTCRPARPIVQILYLRYLAARPMDEIQCVAQTRHRARCETKMLASGSPGGVWKLVPATATQGQLALPSEVMALYDLSSLPYADQLRWRSQRCPQHAAVPTAADLALADWEPFDTLVHHEHVHPRLPTHVRRSRSHGDVRKAVR